MTDPEELRVAESNKKLRASLAQSVRRLAHYNKWLMADDRVHGKPYPGFPEDLDPSVIVDVDIPDTPPVVVKERRKKRTFEKPTTKSNKKTVRKKA